MSTAALRCNRQKEASMRSGNSQAGFSYLLLLTWLTIMAIMLLKSQDHLATEVRQQQEEQLLFVGDQIRNAIKSYRGDSGNTDGKPNDEIRNKDSCFPVNFEQLIFDKRNLKSRFHLRRLYLDPFTQKANWVKIFDSQGRWIGVHTSHKGQPLKKIGFSEDYKNFEKVKSYQDWAFKVNEDISAPLPEKCQK